MEVKSTQGLRGSLTECVDQVLQAWSLSLAPLTEQFLAGKITSTEFERGASETYGRALGEFDRSLARVMGTPHDEPSEILDDPDVEGGSLTALALYPVSITGHNLFRLITVLVADTAGGFAMSEPMAERLVDLRVAVARIGELLHSIAQQPSKE